MSISGDVRKAIQALVHSKHWQNALLENVYWASCEGLLQSALLTEFNALSSAVVASREKALQSYWKPDLAMIPRSGVTAWHDAVDRGDRAEMSSLAKAVFEVKVTWTKPCCSGGASLTAKADEIREQQQALREFAESHPKVATGVVIAIAGGADSDEQLEGDLNQAGEELAGLLDLSMDALARDSVVAAMGGSRTYGKAPRVLGLRFFLVGT
jgi:hypothetical protein